VNTPVRIADLKVIELIYVGIMPSAKTAGVAREFREGAEDLLSAWMMSTGTFCQWI